MLPHRLITIQFGSWRARGIAGATCSIESLQQEGGGLFTARTLGSPKKPSIHCPPIITKISIASEASYPLRVLCLFCTKDDKNTFDWQKIENLVDQGVLATDTKERYDIYTELWSMIMDTKTILPLYHGAVGIAWSDRVKIDSINPFYYHLTDISWAK